MAAIFPRPKILNQMIQSLQIDGYIPDGLGSVVSTHQPENVPSFDTPLNNRKRSTQITYVFGMVRALSRLFILSMLYMHVVCGFGCETSYTKKPLYGFRCIGQVTTEVSIWQADRPQCVWRCSSMTTCHYINHNPVTGQCEVGLERCEDLEPAPGIMVNVYGPPRQKCLHWGSKEEPGRVTIKWDGAKIVYLARTLYSNALVVGKSVKNGKYFANMEGQLIGPIYQTDQIIEFLTMDASCTVSWVPYTAGTIFPIEAVIGGHLENGLKTYVIRVIHNGNGCFGYYDAQSQFGYYEIGGAKTTTSMDVLVLL